MISNKMKWSKENKNLLVKKNKNLLFKKNKNLLLKKKKKLLLKKKKKLLLKKNKKLLLKKKKSKFKNKTLCQRKSINNKQMDQMKYFLLWNLPKKLNLLSNNPLQEIMASKNKQIQFQKQIKNMKSTVKFSLNNRLFS